MTGSKVSMPSATSPWTITPVSNVLVGYSKDLCYRCATFNHQTSAVDYYPQNFQIVQLSQCGLALTALTLPQPMAKLSFVLKGATGKTFSYTDFFIYTMPTCSLTCTLQDQSCSSPLSGSELSSSGSLTPWTFTAKDDVPQGYTKDACFRCQSTIHTFDQHFQIVQDP